MVVYIKKNIIHSKSAPRKEIRRPSKAKKKKKKKKKKGEGEEYSTWAEEDPKPTITYK